MPEVKPRGSLVRALIVRRGVHVRDGVPVETPEVLVVLAGKVLANAQAGEESGSRTDVVGLVSAIGEERAERQRPPGEGLGESVAQERLDDEVEDRTHTCARGAEGATVGRPTAGAAATGSPEPAMFPPPDALIALASPAQGGAG